MAGKIIAYLFLVGCLVSMTAAIKCYVCYSHLDSNCIDKRDIIDAGYEADCSAAAKNGTEEEACDKARSVGKILGFDFDSVNRTCGSSYRNDICKHQDGLEFEALEFAITDAKVWQCTCRTDLCNGSAGTTPLTLNLAIVAIVGCMLMRYSVRL